MSEAAARLIAALEGRYTVDREVGRGGMATVYLAEDLKHHRKVALKVLKPELAAIVGADRFLAEITTTASLQHPHILPLFDSGEADGFLFYVMPYVEGETLRQRLDREHQLPIDDAVRIATDIAEALDYAHRHGVIHRDIKPGNVLIHDGQPVISDFGIALAIGAAGGDRLTDTGLSLGTPNYMSPEQASGDRDVGPASDIYSLTCVLYEMLVGDPPHVGSTAQAVLWKIITNEPESATVQRPSVPAHVDAALRKGSEKLPADRFRTAAEFAQALADESFRHGQPMVASAPRERAAVPSAGWVAAAVLAVALGWVVIGQGENGEPTRQGVERFSLARHESQPAALEMFSVAPDGKAMIYRGRPSGGARSLWLRRWDDLTPQVIPGTESGAGSDFSPAGDEVVFVAGGKLKVLALRSGLVRTVADPGGCCPSWGSDGFIYFTRQGIHRVSARGGNTEEITKPTDQGIGHVQFVVLPARDVAVFQVVGGGDHRIEAIRLSTGERKPLTPGMKPFLSPEGHLIYVSAEGQIMAARFDTEAMELVGEPVSLVDGVNTGALPGFPLYDVAQSGTLVYTTGIRRGQQLEWVSRSGTSTPVDSAWVGDIRQIALSPNGSSVVFISGGLNNLAESSDIWIKQLDRGPLLRITTSGEENNVINIRPSWANDGSSVLFTSDFDAYMKRADGVGVAELVLDLPDYRVWDAWPTGDASRLLHTRNYITCPPPTCDAGIYLRDLEGDSVIAFIDNPGTHELSPALSPSGKWIAYYSAESGRGEVYVRPFPNVDDGRWLVSQDGGSQPVWAHSGRELFYLNRDRELVAVDVTSDADFEIGASQVLFSAFDYRSNWQDPHYAVAPGDDRFLMIRSIAGSNDSQLIVVRNWFEEVNEKLGG